MSEYCGDKASIKYKVDANKVGDFANIIVQRLDRKTITASNVQELKQTETEMIWPDQEDSNGNYYGGRQVDFKGLDKKNYADKFAHQNFTLRLTSMDETVESEDTEIIKEIPPKGPDNIKVSSLPAESWDVDTPESVHPLTGNVISATYILPPGNNFPAGTYQDKFEIEQKDGVVIITIKINLIDPAKGKDTSNAFKYMKKRVESFWNSEACGFNRWVYHRTKCKRGKDCKCSIVRNSKGEYTTTGCCKVPFRVKIEKGGPGDNQVNLHYLNPFQRLKVIAHEMGLDDGWGARNLPVRVDTSNIYYPENRTNTYAHEIGHMMGFPDQYEEGVTVAGAMSTTGTVSGASWPIDNSSIMGGSQNEAKKYHHSMKEFNDWINKIDLGYGDMESIDKS